MTEADQGCGDILRWAAAFGPFDGVKRFGGFRRVGGGQVLRYDQRRDLGNPQRERHVGVQGLGEGAEFVLPLGLAKGGEVLEPRRSGVGLDLFVALDGLEGVVGGGEFFALAEHLGHAIMRIEDLDVLHLPRWAGDDPAVGHAKGEAGVGETDDLDPAKGAATVIDGVGADGVDRRGDDADGQNGHEPEAKTHA